MADKKLTKDELDNLLNLIKKQMVSYQRAFGFIVTGLRNVVTYPEKEIRDSVQAEVDNITQGILLSHIFATWEDHVPREMESRLLNESRLGRLKAFRHIRHTYAHSSDGSRANLCRAEFEKLMKSDNPFKGLVWDEKEDTINASQSNIALDCMSYLSMLANLMIIGQGKSEQFLSNGLK